jgi:hypothetical protein
MNCNLSANKVFEITGELFTIESDQLGNFIKGRLISIGRLKKGPANHKSLLTSEGKKKIKARKKRLNFIRNVR